jgi:glycosyltransferase involved in cell wall biosynthesis
MLSAKATVVVPAYNEAKNIERLLKDIRSAGDYEIIVIDDGSKDNTAGIAKKYANVLRLEKNTGKGNACRIGAKAAKNERLVFIDGDGQLSPREIPKFLDGLKNYSLVIGNRPIKNVPFRRKLANKFAKFLIKKMTKLDVDDCLCGFRAIRKADFEKLHLTKSRYEFESEMLIKAARNNFQIKYIPVSVSYGKKGGMPFVQSVKVALYLIKSIFE